MFRGVFLFILFNLSNMMKERTELMKRILAGLSNISAKLLRYFLSLEFSGSFLVIFVITFIPLAFTFHFIDGERMLPEGGDCVVFCGAISQKDLAEVRSIPGIQIIGVYHVSEEVWGTWRLYNLTKILFTCKLKDYHRINNQLTKTLRYQGHRPPVESSRPWPYRFMEIPESLEFLKLGITIKSGLLAMCIGLIGAELLKQYSKRTTKINPSP